MVIYEVNLEVEASAAEAFASWLAPHIEEMLALDTFTGAQWFDRRARDEGGDDDGNVRWTVHYTAACRADLDRYLSEHAPRMRGDGLERFAGKFNASRRILSRRS